MTGEPSGDLTLAVVAQMSPVGRFGGIKGDPLPNLTLDQYAEQVTHYLAGNLEKFAEGRGADLFVHVVATRNGKAGGHEYRSGHYLEVAKVPLAEPYEQGLPRGRV